MPSNGLLGLTKDQTRPKAIFFKQELLSQLQQPVIQLMLRCEIAFGFTKSEILRWRISFGLFDNKIHLNRTITFNRKERWIPIITDAQRAALLQWKQLVPDEQCLLERYGYRVLMQGYREAIVCFSPTPKIVQYRRFYAIARYQQLQQASSPKRLILQTLQQEMGLSFAQIRRYWREQS